MKVILWYQPSLIVLVQSDLINPDSGLWIPRYPEPNLWEQAVVSPILLGPVNRDDSKTKQFLSTPRCPD